MHSSSLVLILAQKALKTTVFSCFWSFFSKIASERDDVIHVFSFRVPLKSSLSFFSGVTFWNDFEAFLYNSELWGTMSADCCSRNSSCSDMLSSV